jgi:serine/threonine protein kinase
VLLTADYEPVIGCFRSADFCSPVSSSPEYHSRTPLFDAPESIIGNEHNFSTDVFAFAITLYSMFASLTALDDGTIPRNPNIWRTKIADGNRPVPKREIPDFYWTVITACWGTGPDHRPTFWRILGTMRAEHDYVLPGADRAAVLAYEAKVYGDFGPPPSVFPDGRNANFPFE